MMKNKMKKNILSAVGIILVLLGANSLDAAEPRVVRVGAFNYYPGIFKDTDGVVKGFYVDTLADIGQRENIRFDYVYGSWTEGLERIKSGEVDVLTSVAFTEERARFLDYTATPLLTVWAELYTTAASGIDGILEVQDKKIAVMKGDFNAANFINLVKNFHISCNLVEKSNFDEVFKAIASKEVDAGVANSTFGIAKHKEYGLRSTGLVFNPFDIFFAVAKGKNQALLTILETNLANWRIQDDSPYEYARQKWMHQVDTVTVIPRWIVIVLIATGFSALVTAVFVLVLKQQVKRKTISLIESAYRYKILADRQDAILKSVPDIIMEVDTERVYTWANSAGIAFFGDDVIGKEAGYYFEGEQETYQKTWPLIEGAADILYVESRQRRRDGETRLLAWWCKALADNQGKVTGTLSTARDITDSRQVEEEKEKLQEQLIQAQKMESIGRLAGGVAHDFNNMLSVILGNTEIIMEDTDPSNPLISNMKEIHNAAERSTNLTRQLLAFARKQTISPKVLNLNETVGTMLKMLQRLIGEDISLVWLPAENLWTVKMDPSQIDQLLTNLCVNARDAIIKSVGKVTIETSNISFDEDYCCAHTGIIPGNYVMLSVSDNGPGMDKEILNNLFEPFFTTKGVGQGTGLGLATIYGIVKQNKGFINVYTELGEGTTFKIYLSPYIETIVSGEERNVTKAAPTGHETILLVEDEKAILKMAQLMLERLGYNVLAASSPAEALRIVEKSNENVIHLLMTDVVMPEMNGREMAKKLLSRFPDLKCLFMSGYTANVIAHHGILDEGVQFINKPFSKQNLAIKVREVLDSGKG